MASSLLISANPKRINSTMSSLQVTSITRFEFAVYTAVMTKPSPKSIGSSVFISLTIILMSSTFSSSAVFAGVVNELKVTNEVMATAIVAKRRKIFVCFMVVDI